MFYQTTYFTAASHIQRTVATCRINYLLRLMRCQASVAYPLHHGLRGCGAPTYKATYRKFSSSSEVPSPPDWMVKCSYHFTVCSNPCFAKTIYNDDIQYEVVIRLCIAGYPMIFNVKYYVFLSMNDTNKTLCQHDTIHVTSYISKLMVV